MFSHIFKLRLSYFQNLFNFGTGTAERRPHKVIDPLPGLPPQEKAGLDRRAVCRVEQPVDDRPHVRVAPPWLGLGLGFSLRVRVRFRFRVRGQLTYVLHDEPAARLQRAWSGLG